MAINTAYDRQTNTRILLVLEDDGMFSLVLRRDRKEEKYFYVNERSARQAFRMNVLWYGAKETL